MKTKAHGRVWIKKVYKERLSQTHWLWHFIVYGEKTGNFELLIKYPVGKEYTERVKELGRADMVEFWADVVDGEFFVTNITPSAIGPAEVFVELRGSICNILPFYGGRKLLVENDYGMLPVIVNDEQKYEPRARDEIEISATIHNGRFLAKRIEIKRRYAHLIFDASEIDEILAKLQ